MLGMLWLYQKLLSPWIGNQCRFYPTCSEYARQAVEVHGSLRGSALAAKRLCKCHPWHAGGFDYVPGTEPGQEQHRCSDHTAPGENAQ
nr:membrane protein insertion efficiency factor YidD [Alcanivorax sp.]